MRNEKPGIASALGLPSIDELKEITKDSLYNIDFDEDEDDIQTEISSITQEEIEKAKQSMSQLKEVRNQLKDIPDITKRKDHLDRLARLAESKFEDIFDRGFSCEDRFMAEIIAAANNMLKIALDAHVKVIDSDIKLIDMQIKKDKMEIELNLKAKTPLSNLAQEETEDGTKVIRASRNDIINSKKNNK